MRNFIKNFAKDESGATAIEYGLIAALMAVIIIAGIGMKKLKGMKYSGCEPCCCVLGAVVGVDMRMNRRWEGELSGE